MHINAVEKGDPKLGFGRVDVSERKLTDGEKGKLKDYEKEISKKDFIDRYGKEEVANLSTMQL